MGLGFWNLPVTVTRRGRWLPSSGEEMCETECAWWWWSSVRFGEQFEMERWSGLRWRVSERETRLKMESERERDETKEIESERETKVVYTKFVTLKKIYKIFVQSRLY
jgi:hypothetical protein